jgi:hypothetical protein
MFVQVGDHLEVCGQYKGVVMFADERKFALAPVGSSPFDRTRVSFRNWQICSNRAEDYDGSYWIKKLQHGPYGDDVEDSDCYMLLQP